MGCPIRISADQCLLAAPRGFSQPITSFIASWRQGIHQMPFLRLILNISRIHRTQGQNPHARQTPLDTSTAAITSSRYLRTREQKTENRDQKPPDPSKAPLVIHMLPVWPAFASRLGPRSLRGIEQLFGCSMVEPIGIEPTTSCLQSRRSPN